MTCDGKHGGYAPCDDPQCWHRNPARKPVGSILDEAERLTSEDRRQAYGHPLDDYNCTAAIWTAMLKHAGLIPKDTGYQISPELAQAMMIALKLVRFTYNPEHRDSLVDIAGYARTIEMTIEERSRRWAKAMNEAGETPDYPALPSCDGVHRGPPCIDPRCHIWDAVQVEREVVNQVNEDATASGVGAS